MATEEERVRRRRVGSTQSGEPPIFDAWTPISFKAALGNVNPKQNPLGGGFMAPTWVGEHSRRLQAYMILQSFVDNASRFWLAGTEDVRATHREYGDAALVRDQILGALIGADQTIVTENASDFSEDLPDTASDLEQKKSEEGKPAHDLQEWLQDWADLEKFPEKIIECERDAVGLGDGVYVLSWNATKDRVRLRVYDPGFYFPVLTDGNDDDFPKRVHVAWELEPAVDSTDKRLRVRRLTWELREMPGGATRSYAWNDEPSTETVYFTDAIYTVEASSDVDRFKVEQVDYQKNSEGVEAKELDLEIDFLPVVHIPNTVALKNHYGKSSLSTVLQILDDLANADTDLQASSATTGKPPLALSGGSFSSEEKPTYRPGEVWQLGENGRLTALDTSSALEALMRYVESLLKRMSVNARIPEAVLGRIDKGEVGSGIQLRLMFGPLESMVREMRLVRQEKYPLLLKFVWRMATAGKQADTPTEFIRSEVAFGSFLPQDLAGQSEVVIALMTSKSISLETAIQMLLEAGVPIEDVIEEIQRIQRRDFTGATELLDATGDEDAVFEYLQRDRPVQTAEELAAQQAAAAGTNRPPPPGAQPPPPINLPPTPAQPPGTAQGGGGAQP